MTIRGQCTIWAVLRTEEQIVDIPVPPIEEEITDVMWSSHVAAHAAPTPVNVHLASSFADTNVVPARVIDYVTPSLVFEYIAPAPSVTSCELFSR